jgi:phospholipid/cholesterol/gamma-HCH transport system ATP-binding protein
MERKDVKIEIRGLSKILNNRKVLDGVNLDILEGETFVLIGQSGVGKSVLIKNLIGIMHPDAGTISLDGELIDYENVEKSDRARRKFGMLFQGGALFDSLTVGENILFPLDHLRGELSDAQKEEKVLRALEMVELPGIENLMISSLSGGMMKRVALARAIVAEPEVVLFDEPTTGLDPITTSTINDLILTLKKKLNTTFVVVTHDIGSAKYIGDRIGMVYRGNLIFIGTPRDLENTDNEYVKQFVRGASEGPITDEYNANVASIIRQSREAAAERKRR